MNIDFDIKIEDLDLVWAFDEVVVYNNAFHSDLIKEYFYTVWAVHKKDPTEPHTGHSGPVIFKHTANRVRNFIEFKDITHEDMVKWTKRNIDTKKVYDIIISQLKKEMVYRTVKLPFVEELNENEPS